jgi:DNA polymerase III subunit gamma/tau
MSYVVLARKYRPRSFDQMVGQPHVVQALGNALAQQRLHHAYLFTGTRGIGKTTVSRILAKSLNCTGPDGTGGITAEPCGVCPACTAIDADRFVDYIELDAASNRSIDEIRDLIERAAYKPSVGRFKVFMIDEAHQLTKDAFNALLKTLEEPPEYLKFVLATTDPEKMLPTVLSRCLQFNLRPMAPETGAGAPGRGAGRPSRCRSSRRAAPARARRARLDARRAVAHRPGHRLRRRPRRRGGGARDARRVRPRPRAGAGRRRWRARRAGAAGRRARAARAGASAPATLEAMAGLLQQMAVEQAVPGALDDADPDTKGAGAAGRGAGADETQLLYSIVLHGRAELALASDEHAALTMVLLRCSPLRRWAWRRRPPRGRSRCAHRPPRWRRCARSDVQPPHRHRHRHRRRWRRARSDTTRRPHRARRSHRPRRPSRPHRPHPGAPPAPPRRHPPRPSRARSATAGRRWSRR